MATTIPAIPTTQTINQLLMKLTDNDPDLRFMSLNDLIQVLTICKPDLLLHDYNTAARTVDHVVRALDDSNGEVQNLAIKCLGPLVARLPSQVIGPMIEKVSSLKPKNAVDGALPAMALKSVIEALPRPVPGANQTKEVIEAYVGISRVLIPRLLGKAIVAPKTPSAANVRLPPPAEGLLQDNSKGNYGRNAESVNVLIEVVRCFGPMLASVEVEALQEAVVGLLELENGASVVKKRAVVAMSILAVYFSDEVLNDFINRSLSALKRPDVLPVTRRLYITIMGSMARSVPHRFDQHLKNVVPLVLGTLGEEELEQQLEAAGEGDDATEFNEVRESALVALEAFLASCANQMRPYTDGVIAACLRYLKYDPNYNMDDEDEEMEDEEDELDEMDDDDEFEMDAGFDDDDDASWKIRRCAAKALHTLISTRSSGDLLENGVLYNQVAPSLIRRFEEREENVRLEVISATSLLVRKTGEGIIPEFSLESPLNEFVNQPPQSRKRRRQSSGGGAGAASFGFTTASSTLSETGLTSPTLEKLPTTGPRADLVAKIPAIVKACTKQLKGKLIATKQAIINLLDDIVAVQQGGLSEYFDSLVGLIIDAIKPTAGGGAAASLPHAGGAASATPGTLRIAALRLMSHVAKTHSSQHVQPYLPSIVGGVLAAVHDRNYKISGEAIQAVEELTKAVTPPRSRLTSSRYKGELQKMFDVLIDRAGAPEMDAEVRQKAIHALGTLLSRTSSSEGSALLPPEKRQLALELLLDRLKNETTRLASVRAIDSIAASASSGVPLETEWAQAVAVELAAQLRKSNRVLRASCIHALRNIVHSQISRGKLDQPTTQALVEALQPVVASTDPHLLGPALRILSELVREAPSQVADTGMTVAICNLLQTNVAISVLDPLLQLVTNIGKAGAGQKLMQGLLQDVGINGDPAVVGKVIGNLLVASGDTAGVSIPSFINEIQASKGDAKRTSLALAVLGEAGLRLGPGSPIKPELFLSQFSEDFDKVSVSAAVALGQAGSGNIPQYLPVILGGMTMDSGRQYLLLHSIKEVLQQVAASNADIGAFSASIWERLLQAAVVEDNKAVCAECIGRLAIIAPQIYVPKLQVCKVVTVSRSRLVTGANMRRQALLKDRSQTLRAIAIQALRYTLPDDADAFDAVLKDYLVDMLNVMLNDGDMEIRRLAMTALNSAAHNKPELIFQHLGTLMPFVMTESKVKPELIREVQMGPFKHMVDDGLELRKGAYETLYALMETAFSRISIIDLYDRIVDGLGDDNDIRALCNLMVSKLVYIAPEETRRRLDAIAEKFRTTLSTKLKDNAVKQEHEKQDEANKAVLRVTLLLGEKLKASLSQAGAVVDPAQYPKWTQYWEWVNRDFALPLKALREENKELAGVASF
jgi:cullin-associated NEDD8-dissociated protein 1